MIVDPETGDEAAKCLGRRGVLYAATDELGVVDHVPAMIVAVAPHENLSRMIHFVSVGPFTIASEPDPGVRGASPLKAALHVAACAQAYADAILSRLAAEAPAEPTPTPTPPASWRDRPPLL